VIAVQRESLELGRADAQAVIEVGYYASSLNLEQRDDAGVAAAIRGHWSAIENGTHYRRDVTFGEDACRVKDRNGAAVLASLRNLANGIYELEREGGRTRVDTLRSWCQQQTFSSAWPLLQR
jgi:predicted transposase YbfD/YdcC